MKYFIYLFIFSVFFSASNPALADCLAPTGEEGEIIYNGSAHVPQFCDGEDWIALGEILTSAGGSCTNPSAPEGTIIFNDGAQVPQFCNGSDWVSMITRFNSGCKVPPLCPNIGDVCDDGNAANDPDPVFAGLLFYDDYTCKQVFAPQADQSADAQWKTSTGTDDIATDSTEDGKINHSQVIVRADYIADPNVFPAFKLCEDLTYGGFTDWYLPARTELDLLWRNKAAIGGFTTSYYRSSTESNTFNAWYQDFNSGGQNRANKTNNYDVRCIRSESAASGITHCTAPSLCPNVGDICDDGDDGNNPDPVFAGWLVYANSGNCEPLYTTQSDQSTSSQWKNATGDDDITPNDSVEDGKVNHANRQGTLSDFPAFELCEDLTDGGYEDWYLPARTELDLLWRNREAINDGAAGNFTTSYYWSSTEYITTIAWIQDFSNGYQGYNNKTFNRGVRCVRRD